MTNKPFGQSLIENKLITEDQLSLALKKQKRETGKYLGEILIGMSISQSKINHALDTYNKRRGLGDILIESKYMTRPQLNHALEKQKKNNKELGIILRENNYVTNDKILESVSKYLNMPIFPLKNFTPTEKYQKEFGPTFASKNKVIILESNKDYMKIGLTKPKANLIDLLRSHLEGKKRNLEFCLLDPIEYENCIKRTGNSNLKGSSDFRFISTSSNNESIKPAYAENAEAERAKGITVKILKDATSKEASDIHIDEKLRYRIDGIMRVINPPKGFEEKQEPIISIVKILTESMRIDEKRLPQDGSFGSVDYINGKEKRIDHRVSTIPLPHNKEKMVIRILDQDKAKVPLDELGLSKNVLTPLIQKIEDPSGIVIVTGPTGSGKTTTLYGSLNRINTPEVNILTVEDPIEYTIEGITQTQVNENINLTFARLLKSFLRQDPDIIMIGEIRDEEPASIALKAAQSGHLVLSTMHTTDTTESLYRLNGLGLDYQTLIPSISCILGQRLVRKICPNCIETYQPDPKQVNKHFGSEKPDMQFYKGKGCDQCYNEGYKGRIALNEIWTPNSDEIGDIEDINDPNIVRENAIKHGLISFYQDGLTKLKNKQTSLDQLIRVSPNIEKERDLYQKYRK